MSTRTILTCDRCGAESTRESRSNWATVQIVLPFSGKTLDLCPACWPIVRDALSVPVPA